MNRKPIEKSNWAIQNLANMITLLGFMLCAVLLWVVITQGEQILTILLLAGLVMLTDFIDGPLARRLEKRYPGSVSSFGTAADRFRDKSFQFIMFGFLLFRQQANFWVKAAIVPLVVAEILLLTISIMGVRRGMNVSANKYGKIKMFLICCAILVCLTNVAIGERWGLKLSSFAAPASAITFAVSLLFAAQSFVKHVAEYRKQLLRSN